MIRFTATFDTTNNRANDVEFSTLEVDISPLQPEEFALSQPG
jgi:hypothetical protein